MAASLKVGTKSNNLVDIPAEPDAISWGIQDISASDAGRVQDGTNKMYKNRTSQKRKLQLSWTNISLAKASAILQMFNPEYVYVRYMDVYANGMQTRQFYVGDRTAPFRQITLNNSDGTKTVVSSLSFDIIER